MEADRPFWALPGEECYRLSMKPDAYRKRRMVGHVNRMAFSTGMHKI